LDLVDGHTSNQADTGHGLTDFRSRLESFWRDSAELRITILITHDGSHAVPVFMV
jgi:hypothetical protein